MISLKQKICKGCDKPSYLFSKGYCKNCYNTHILVPKLRKDPKIRKILNKSSQKQRERDKQYLKVRDDYLKLHPVCEVCSMHLADQIHHKRGRIGSNLFKYFLAVCDLCHKLIENNPVWAKEHGYSESRLKDDDGEYNNDS